MKKLKQDRTGNIFAAAFAVLFPELQMHILTLLL